MMIAAQSRPRVNAEPPPALPGFEHIIRRWDGGELRWCAKVLPGEYYVSTGGEFISTLLGSCVAACVSDLRTGRGGMNHFLLPDGDGRDLVGLPTRYGVAAMESLLNGLLRLGSSRDELKVKLFGGARMLDNLADVGERNILFVREFLRTEGLAISAEDLGGDQARRVNFWPDSGRVRIRRLPKIRNREVVSQEQQLRQRLTTDRLDGGVELF